MATRLRQYQPQHTRLTKRQRREWAATHGGQFALIAQVMGFSRAHVCRVFWGHRQNPAISRALDAVIFNGNGVARAA